MEVYVGRTRLLLPFKDLPFLLPNRIGLLISMAGLPISEVVVEGIHCLRVCVERALKLFAHGLALNSTFVIVKQRSMGILGWSWRQVFLVHHSQPCPECAFITNESFLLRDFIQPDSRVQIRLRKPWTGSEFGLLRFEKLRCLCRQWLVVAWPWIVPCVIHDAWVFGSHRVLCDFRLRLLAVAFVKSWVWVIIFEKLIFSLTLGK